MPGRKFNGGDYRYGFNGKENDNEIKGDGNSIDFGARMYDSRLGRWFKTDPLAYLQPDQSPYKFGLNNPIYFIDPDGKTEYTYIKVINKDTGKSHMLIVKSPGLMTDGIKHNQYERGAILSKDYDENYYYDYSTSMTRVVDNEGKIISESDKKIVRIHSSGVIKGRESVFWGDDYGDTKIQGISLKIWGSGAGGTTIWNSNKPDESDFIYSMDLSDDFWSGFFTATGAIGGSKPDGVKGEWGEMAKSFSETISKLHSTWTSFQAAKKDWTTWLSENPAFDGKVVCPSCKEKRDSTHIDNVNDVGTYSKEKKKLTKTGN